MVKTIWVERAKESTLSMEWVACATATEGDIVPYLRWKNSNLSLSWDEVWKDLVLGVIFIEIVLCCVIGVPLLSAWGVLSFCRWATP